MAKKLTTADLQEQLNTLSLSEVLSMLKAYSEATGTDISEAKNRLVTDDLQNRLSTYGINTTCPHCGSENYIRNGSNGNIKRFKCKDCDKSFTLFSGTILEKTKYHWDIWVEVVWMVLNDFYLEDMQTILINDFGLTDLNYKTVFLWKHKIVHALAEMPMPQLSGIVQVDETYFRESQKGSRKLTSTVKGEKRQPRYGRRMSHLGVMGNEFANVVVATDWRGYCVSKVVGLGKLTVDTFTDLFDEHIVNPQYLCSDGNFVYRDYCRVKGIPLYVRPSNYLQTIERAGYVTPDWTNPAVAKATEENNDKILAKLYNDGLIDYIYGREKMSYKEFSGIKYANSLGLARVNQFHAELKNMIEAPRRNVSTKYLQDYVGFYTYLRNWSITNGHEPRSHRDAETVLVEILKGKTTYTTTDLKEADMPSHKASDKYMAMLRTYTEAMRKKTKNPYFKYDAEDNVVSFNKKEYLLDLPDVKLKKLCSKYRVPQKWARYMKVCELLRKPTIVDDIMELIREDRWYDISEEDRKYLGDRMFLNKP